MSQDFFEISGPLCSFLWKKYVGKVFFYFLFLLNVPTSTIFVQCTLRFDNKRYHILLNCRWQLVILDKELGSGSGDCNNVSRKAFCFIIQVSTFDNYEIFFQSRIALF